MLGRLGVNIDAPTSQYSLAYEVFLPEAAAGGYYRLLRDAQRASQHPDAWDTGEELTWLAEHLRVRPSNGRLPWWDEAWTEAAERTNAADPVHELSERAKQLLVQKLYDEPAYPSLSEDALVEAFRVDTRH